MKTSQEIIQRIGVLTAMIGAQQDKIYDLALRNKNRKALWEIHEADRKAIAYYNELMVLEWVLDDKEARQ